MNSHASPPAPDFFRVSLGSTPSLGGDAGGQAFAVQVHTAKASLLFYRPAAGGRTPVLSLEGLRVEFAVPLFLSAARGRRPTPGSAAAWCVCLDPPKELSGGLARLSGLKAFPAAALPPEVAGNVVLECESERDARLLLAQLQIAGCAMTDLEDRYVLGELVGVGSSSKVFLAEDCLTGEPTAVKLVSKTGNDKDLPLLQEATILRWAQHPNILHFLGLYETRDPATQRDAWGIVTEFLAGGELFEEVRQRGAFNERRASGIVAQLFSAIDFLHQRGVVHRDIKTENVILIGIGDDVKLVDFGLAAPEWDAAAMAQRCGSPGYIAPEVLRGETYGSKVDCFSIGVLMYILLSGFGPFRGSTVEEMLIRNVRCRVSLRSLGHCSSHAIGLIQRLLTPVPESRITAQQALSRPWLASGAEALDREVAGVAPAPAEVGEAVPPQPQGGEKRRMFSSALVHADMFSPELRFEDEEGLGGETPHAQGTPGADLEPPPSQSERSRTPPPVPERPAAELEELPRPSGPAPSLLRTSTPIWANVQQTLNVMRTEGLNPLDKGGFASFKRKIKVDAALDDDIAPARHTAHADHLRRQEEEEEDFMADRISAFTMRDLLKSRLTPNFASATTPVGKQVSGSGDRTSDHFGARPSDWGRTSEFFTRHCDEDGDDRDDQDQDGFVFNDDCMLGDDSMMMQGDGVTSQPAYTPWQMQRRIPLDPRSVSKNP